MENKKLDKRSKNITIGDIAKELGISKTTVSRAISGNGRIGIKTKRRVLDFIELNNYRPNVIAKGLAKSRTYNIGVVLPSDADSFEAPFFQKCLLGICEVASRRDYDVVVTSIDDQDRHLLERIVRNRKVDGLVITRMLFNDYLMEYLKDLNMPYVVLGTFVRPNLYQVDNDHLSGCRELTNILFANGLEDIGLILGNPAYPVNRQRYMGFKEGVEKNNHIVDGELVVYNANSKTLVEDAVEKIMKKKAGCILCGDDLICMRVVAKLTKEGFEIPTDIKVASFYNSQFLDCMNPPITSVDFNARELGNVAGLKVIELIEKGITDIRTTLGYKVSVTESTQL